MDFRYTPPTEQTYRVPHCESVSGLGFSKAKSQHLYSAKLNALQNYSSNRMFVVTKQNEFRCAKLKGYFLYREVQKVIRISSGSVPFRCFPNFSKIDFHARYLSFIALFYILPFRCNCLHCLQFEGLQNSLGFLGASFLKF